ncbi:hypothetical protein FPANT_7657 [Fusarium pseudoanthophilum]|uniref:Uncharacterized protein n=1 Tax=Fusarium pseudoanthophilum TaxID=48495 RepID=A0A8H5L6Q4_9HYPO|nr:hypothetical protein FPANT_7657 [Fusarium pseudoanthophilum]
MASCAQRCTRLSPISFAKFQVQATFDTTYSKPIIQANEVPKYDRPLILYAYAESEVARANLEYFVVVGLHSAADFVFIFNGETNADSLIPDAPNIRIVHRNNTCFDLGAYGEVLRTDSLWTHYRRFITMNASIRGPFLPYWAQSKSACWSDLYLDRINEKVKLVGMSANCMPRFHIQSMIWATDSVGMKLLLFPNSSTLSPADGFGAAGAPVAYHSCYDGWHSAVHAEVGTAEMIIAAGYDVDAMMEAYHKSKGFRYDCHADGVGDLLFNGRYFGSNIHPYETIFMKANRNIDPKLLQSLTEWHLAEGRRSWDICQSYT